MMSKRTKAFKIIFLSAAIFLLLGNVALAAPSWWPIVPCGLSKPATPPADGYLADSYYLPCNACDLFHMGRNIIDFILIGLMPPVAAGLFIWGGFLILMGGPKPELFAKGKAIFTTTFYGVLVILASWLITNTIMMSVAQDSVTIKNADGTTTVVNIVTNWSNFECVATTVTEPPPPTPNNGGLTISPDSLPDVVINHDYSQQLSVSGGKPSYTWSSSDADSVLPSGCGFLPDTSEVVCNADLAGVGAYTFNVQVTDSTTPTALTATKQYKLTILEKANALTITTNATLPDAPIGVAYNQTLSANGGIAPYSWTAQGAWPAGLQMSNAGVIIGTPTSIGTSTPVITVTDNSTPPISFKKTMTLKVVSGTAATACLFSGVNLCDSSRQVKVQNGQIVTQPNPSCYNSKCGQYITIINQEAAKAGISPNLIKAVMEIESACDTTVGDNTNDGAGSAGLMQLIPGTANHFAQYCNLPPGSINAQYLKEHSQASICLGAQYLKSISQGNCGTSPRNIFAGYDGEGWCAPSVSCAGQTSCDGTPVKKWECLYDDTQHTVCNGDNTVGNVSSQLNTLKYSILNKMYCYNNPGF